MKPLRILHLVHQYPPEFTGGTELYTQMLAEAQAGQGHHVCVFCISTTSRRPARLTAVSRHGLDVYQVPLGERTRTRVFRDTFRKPEVRDALRHVLDTENPDLVHIQHLMGMPMALARQLDEAGIPYLVTLHDYWYMCANAQLLTNTNYTVCSGPDRLFINCAQCALARAGHRGALWLAPALAPLMAARNRGLHKALDGARCVIAPTQFVRQIYAALGADNDNMVVVPHGIKLPEEPPQRAGYSLAKDTRPLRIGYIGSIAWQKGVHVLIQAANLLPEENFELDIFGSLDAFPQYAAQLRHLVAIPHVHFAGHLYREDLWQTLANLDVIVLPALWYETSSLVLDEAFAAGVPVVASAIGALAEKIQDGVNGRLFPPGDAAALRRILQEIIVNPALLRDWQNGIPPVRSIADHVKQIEALYRSALDTL